MPREPTLPKPAPQCLPAYLPDRALPSRLPLVDIPSREALPCEGRGLWGECNFSQPLAYLLYIQEDASGWNPGVAHPSLCLLHPVLCKGKAQVHWASFGKIMGPAPWVLGESVKDPLTESLVWVCPSARVRRRFYLFNLCFDRVVFQQKRGSPFCILSGGCGRVSSVILAFLLYLFFFKSSFVHLCLQYFYFH